MRRLLVAAMLILALCSIAAQARAADPPESIYHLDAALTNQAGVSHGLDIHRGHSVLITMFYASCPATCPMIIDTLRAIERELTAQQRGNLRVLMISLDPERDTPAALKELAATRRIDVTRWTLARTDADTVRTIAALLDVQYRRLPGGELNHSTAILLLSPEGEVEARSSTLGHADAALLAKLRDHGTRR